MANNQLRKTMIIFPIHLIPTSKSKIGSFPLTMILTKRRRNRKDQATRKARLLTSMKRRSRKLSKVHIKNRGKVLNR